ncbi:hypothetical protein [Lentzea sp. NPDC003310]|uniref:hypothetical protein n=1 Tax=Lentzea sp. NPDC003310 TaxID=3154447 RepID=UPI0033B9331D
MSRSRKPRLIYDPNSPENKRALDAAERKVTRLLLVAGPTAILAGSALGMTVQVGFLLLALAGGLAFALGLCGLAGSKQAALPAFLLGLGAPFVLTFGGHSVLMDRIGHVERCVVREAEEHRSAKRPVVEYVLGCPSGDVEITEDWSERLRAPEGDVRIGPPLRPVLAAPDLWNLPLVVGVLVAMTTAIPVARLLRKQP